MTIQNKISKRQKRSMKFNQVELDKKMGMDLCEVQPLTENQSKVFRSYDDGQHLLLTGTAGTGKTFLSLYLALDDIAENKKYHTVTIIRSTVPSRDQGFMPGSEKEKQEVYEAPYHGMFSELYGRGDAYELMKKRNAVRFMSTSFLRGTTLRDTIVIVDEIQNMNFQELDTIFTRIGDNCRVIFCGDIKQNDLISKRNDVSGFMNFFKILNNLKMFDTVEFTAKDIVRSELVKSYIIEREFLESSGQIQTQTS